MKVPAVTMLIPVPEGKWAEVQEAVLEGNTTELARITAPYTIAEKLHAEELYEEKTGEKKRDEEKSDVFKNQSASYFVYNAISYDMPKELVMAVVDRFAKENGLSASKRDALRAVVNDVAEKYDVEKAPDYAEFKRTFLTDEQEHVNLVGEATRDEDMIEQDTERARAIREVEEGLKDEEDSEWTRGRGGLR